MIFNLSALILFFFKILKNPGGGTRYPTNQISLALGLGNKVTLIRKAKGRRQNRKSRKFGTMSQEGGGVKKIRNVPISIWEFWKQKGGSLFFKNVPISIWEFWKQRGGLYFSKMSQFQLFDSVFCNITFIRNVWNSKMSQFGQRGGGQHFSKMSEIQKCPKGRRGGRGQP